MIGGNRRKLLKTVDDSFNELYETKQNKVWYSDAEPTDTDSEDGDLWFDISQIMKSNNLISAISLNCDVNNLSDTYVLTPKLNDDESYTFLIDDIEPVSLDNTIIINNSNSITVNSGSVDFNLSISNDLLNKIKDTHSLFIKINDTELASSFSKYNIDSNTINLEGNVTIAQNPTIVFIGIQSSVSSEEEYIAKISRPINQGHNQSYSLDICPKEEYRKKRISIPYSTNFPFKFVEFDIYNHDDYVYNEYPLCEIYYTPPYANNYFSYSFYPDRYGIDPNAMTEYDKSIIPKKESTAIFFEISKNKDFSDSITLPLIFKSDNYQADMFDTNDLDQLYFTYSSLTFSISQKIQNSNFENISQDTLLQYLNWLDSITKGNDGKQIPIYIKIYSSLVQNTSPSLSYICSSTNKNSNLFNLSYNSSENIIIDIPNSTDKLYIYPNLSANYNRIYVYSEALDDSRCSKITYATFLKSKEESLKILSELESKYALIMTFEGNYYYHEFALPFNVLAEYSASDIKTSITDENIYLFEMGLNSDYDTMAIYYVLTFPLETSTSGSTTTRKWNVGFEIKEIKNYPVDNIFID